MVATVANSRFRKSRHTNRGSDCAVQSQSPLCQSDPSERSSQRQAHQAQHFVTAPPQSRLKYRPGHNLSNLLLRRILSLALSALRNLGLLFLCRVGIWQCVLTVPKRCCMDLGPSVSCAASRSRRYFVHPPHLSRAQLRDFRFRCGTLKKHTEESGIYMMLQKASCKHATSAGSAVVRGCLRQSKIVNPRTRPAPIQA